MAIKPNITQHNSRTRQNVPGDPQPTKVNEIVRRGSSSRYADWLRQMDFVAIREITVAQNTPQHYHESGFEKAPMNGDVMDTILTLDSGTDLEVWVKTATLGGRSRVYVRSL